MTEYYKLLNADGTSPLRGFPWPLPKDGEPGEWLPPIEGDLIARKHGYHVVTLDQALAWRASAMYRVEIDGEIINAGNKHVCRRARLLDRVEGWNAKNLRLFAADCAENVLHIFEAKFPDDDRPRTVIQAARAFARGEIGLREMQRAADAAYAATYAADAAAYATDATHAAAHAADAAYAATHAAERKWQTERLREYLFGDYDKANA